MITSHIAANSKKRLTIGVYLGGLDPYSMSVLSGVFDSADERGMTVLAFKGGSISPKGGSPIMGNLLYKLPSPETIDGLIILSPIVGNIVTNEEMGIFCRQFKPKKVRKNV